ncbi:MAG: hypothetical protein V7K41_12040 [Nostoc sp.]|uniref:hypothetical protein n=1 Tax=Nostoc sp. TaxID=1180 RepID=UPI002FF8C77B
MGVRLIAIIQRGDRTRFSSYTLRLHQQQGIQCKHHRILGKSVVNHATAIERALAGQNFLCLGFEPGISGLVDWQAGQRILKFDIHITQDLRTGHGKSNHRERREHRGIRVREVFCVSPITVEAFVNAIAHCLELVDPKPIRFG